MEFEIPLPACLQRVLEVMKEHPRIFDSQIEVASLPSRPGFVDLVVDAAGFIALDNGREGIYARDKHDRQTYKRYISVETNYLGALGASAEKIATENEVQLFKYDEGGGGDFGVTLPFDSSKEKIRNALDKLVDAVIAYRSQLKEKVRKRTIFNVKRKKR